MTKKAHLPLGQNTPKTILIISIITLLVISLVVGALFFYTEHASSSKKTTIAVYNNTDNGYQVVFEQVGEPFTFGPHNVKITLKDASGKKVDHIDTKISNDGATLSEHNAIVSWEDCKVKVTLRGDEQKDVVYEFYYEHS